ncbi:FkbM family methyltransferase [bacterium]|nr:FkbM family methyltransferase [bacterium]
MVEALVHVFDKKKPKCKGIIHVGGHWGQEIPFYLKAITRNVVVYEPLESCFKILSDSFMFSADCRKKAVGSENRTIFLNVESENHGQSSSVLKPKEHLEQYPDIHFNQTQEAEMVTLDSDIQRPEEFNVLVVDVQGYELEVFKGAEKLLDNHIEYVICEVNNAEMYENCCLVEDLDSFFAEKKFKRILTSWEGDKWGNALYAKF